MVSLQKPHFFCSKTTVNTKWPMFYQLWFKHDFIEYKNNHGFTTVTWFNCDFCSKTMVLLQHLQWNRNNRKINHSLTLVTMVV